MNNCKNCKWWGDEDLVDRYDIEADEVPKNDIPPEIRQCNSPKLIWKFDPKKSIDGHHLAYPSEGGCMIWDGSGYVAGFGTTATFGCTCFEDKQ